jgi:hypothetical protein
MADKTTGDAGKTPEQEDRELFSTYGGPITVEIVPAFQRPNRDLFLAKAFFEGDREIITVFSGRRAFETDHLRRTLEAMESVAGQRAAARRTAPPKTEAIRLPVQIKGSWQHRFFSNDDGDDVKIFQLIVGRWTFQDLQGDSHQFGEAPAFDVKARRRNKSYILQKREIDAVPRSPRLGAAGD